MTGERQLAGAIRMSLPEIRQAPWIAGKNAGRTAPAGGIALAFRHVNRTLED